MPTLGIDGPLGPGGDVMPPLNQPVPVVLALAAENTILGMMFVPPRSLNLMITHMKGVKCGTVARPLGVARSHS